MRTTFIRSGRLVALGAVALLVACGDLPDAPVNDQRIAVIQISGCASVGEGDTCPITGRAWNASGEEIASPAFVWSSSSPSIARTRGSGNQVELVGVSAGQATIRAADATRTVSDEFPVRVSSPSTPPPGGGGGPRR